MAGVGCGLHASVAWVRVGGEVGVTFRDQGTGLALVKGADPIIHDAHPLSLTNTHSHTRTRTHAHIPCQMFTERACAAMARTGFGGDAYHAVIALIGDGGKVIRPVVKPNQDLASTSKKMGSSKRAGQLDGANGANGASSVNTLLSSDFDPTEPLPIHIDVFPSSRVVQVTTTSVFDVHLMEHLTNPEMHMVNDYMVPLARVCAVVHEEIDFVEMTSPVHSRRLNLSLMETPLDSPRQSFG